MFIINICFVNIVKKVVLWDNKMVLFRLFCGYKSVFMRVSS